jgi:gliding motility-associated lipoprotein GldH
MKQLKSFFLFLMFCALWLASCSTVDLYEETVSIPRHEWQSSFRPSFQFEIKDTTSLYKIFVILRHNEKYSFTNIYLNLYINGPGSDTTLKVQRDLLLATAEEGWLASGMDDIYEHRIPFVEKQPLKAGLYTFTLEQIMREDPLKNIMDVGIRVEKEKPE